LGKTPDPLPQRLVKHTKKREKALSISMSCPAAKILKTCSAIQGETAKSRLLWKMEKSPLDLMERDERFDIAGWKPAMVYI